MEKRVRDGMGEEATTPTSRKEGRRGMVTSPSSSPASPAGAAVDRISELPDTLRIQILTLLPLEDAVRTDLLSKSWRGLWKRRWHHTSSLDLTIPGDGTTTKHFVDAAKRRLDERPPPRLEFLRIVFSPRQEDVSLIRRWLEYASDHGVAVVHIDLSPTNRAVPSTSNAPNFVVKFGERGGGSIIRLSLRWCRLIHASAKSRDFSSLERLYLHGVSMDNRSLSNLIQSCPFLKFLDVRCSPDLASISAPQSQLTTLTIVDCRYYQASILVRLRAIRSLRVCSVPSLDLKIINPSLLEDVYLSWGGSSLCWALNMEAWHGIARTTLRYVQALTLGGIPFERIRRLQGIQFDNLRELQLLFTVEGYCNGCYIYEFLNRIHCPCLERLFIQLPTKSLYQIENVDLSVTVLRAGLERLRIIKMTNYGNSFVEQWLVTSFLLKAINLESMILVVLFVQEVGSMNHGHAEFVTHLQQLLESQPRASTNASVLVYEFDQSGVLPIHFNVDQGI